MTTMTFAPASTDDEQPKTSYDRGLLDGREAALTRLPSRQVHDRASMAEQHDWLYAQGLMDGFLHQTEVNAAHRFRGLIEDFHNGTPVGQW